jgi:hypothetical protein
MVNITYIVKQKAEREKLEHAKQARKKRMVIAVPKPRTPKRKPVERSVA